MTTDMRNADLLPQPVRLGRGSEWQTGFLCHWQSIHVRSQRDDRPRVRPSQNADDTCVRNRGTNLQAKLPKVLGNQFSGSIFAIAQFGMLVDIATPSNNLGLDGPGYFINPHT
jgi:hypothetical protein